MEGPERAPPLTSASLGPQPLRRPLDEEDHDDDDDELDGGGGGGVVVVAVIVVIVAVVIVVVVAANADADADADDAADTADADADADRNDGKDAGVTACPGIIGGPAGRGTACTYIYVGKMQLCSLGNTGRSGEEERGEGRVLSIPSSSPLGTCAKWGMAFRTCRPPSGAPGAPGAPGASCSEGLPPPPCMKRFVSGQPAADRCRKRHSPADEAFNK